MYFAVCTGSLTSLMRRQFSSGKIGHPKVRPYLKKPQVRSYSCQSGSPHNNPLFTIALPLSRFQGCALSISFANTVLVCEQNHPIQAAHLPPGRAASSLSRTPWTNGRVARRSETSQDKTNLDTRPESKKDFESQLAHHFECDNEILFVSQCLSHATKYFLS